MGEGLLSDFVAIVSCESRGHLQVPVKARAMNFDLLGGRILSLESETSLGAGNWRGPGLNLMNCAAVEQDSRGVPTD